MEAGSLIVGEKGREQLFFTAEQLVVDLVSKLSSGQVAEAAELYSRCQEDIGYLLINKVQSDKRLQKLTANMLFRSRDFEKAALCCENLSEFDKAAQLYEQSDDYRSAAEMYARVENFEKAAEMFERNQNYRQAAELFLKVRNYSQAAINFEKAVNYFVAGKLYHELGKYRKSMELLQKIQSQEENFQAATLLIGDILAKNGYVDLAIKKILNVIKGRPVDKETAEMYYHLAALHRSKNNLEVAKNIYQQLLQFDITFKDVSEKIKEFEGSGSPSSLAVAAIQDSKNDVETEEEASAQMVGVMEGFDFLQKVPLFADMPLAEMRAFYNICGKRIFHEKEILIEQDRPGMALYVIRSGKVSIQRVEPSGVKEVALLGEGEHLGEMSLVDESLTSARVVAAGTVVAFEILRDHFLRFLDANDKFAVRILRVFVRSLCQRLRDTTSKFATR